MFILRRNLLLAVTLMWLPLDIAQAYDLRERHPPATSRVEHRRIAHELAGLTGGRVLRVADTRSMQPTLDSEDMLITRIVAFDNLRVGDIVVFQFRGGFHGMQYHPPVPVAHRIIWRNRTQIRTKGDNLQEVDPTDHSAEAVLGRVDYDVDGQTGVIRAMRGSRVGSPLSLAAVYANELALADAEDVAAAQPK